MAKPGLKPQKQSFVPHREAEVTQCRWVEVGGSFIAGPSPGETDGGREVAPEGQYGAGA